MCYAIIKVDHLGGNKNTETFEVDSEEQYEDKLAKIKQIGQALRIRVYPLGDVIVQSVEYKAVDHDKMHEEAAKAIKPSIAVVNNVLGTAATILSGTAG